MFEIIVFGLLIYIIIGMLLGIICVLYNNKIKTLSFEQKCNTIEILMICWLFFVLSYLIRKCKKNKNEFN